jgi:hypothetical protein
MAARRVAPTRTKVKARFVWKNKLVAFSRPAPTDTAGRTPLSL